MIAEKETDIENLREAGKRLARVLSMVKSMVRPGISTRELDKKAEELIRAGGDEPSFLGYQPKGAKRPYPATLCVSVNEELVHGVPDSRVLQEGDIVGLDIGLIHNGAYVDMAVTVPVGEVSEEAQKLIDTTKESLNRSISKVRAGAILDDIGGPVEDIAAEHGYGVVRELGGHGVGGAVHEKPWIPNFRSGVEYQFSKNEVIALEPMLTLGGEKIKVGDNGFVYETSDGSLGAHFEHTILVTEKGAEILTQE